MHALFGVFRTDGGAVLPDELAAMAAKFRHRRADFVGLETTSAGAAAFGALAPLGERALADRTASLAVLAGRIDNSETVGCGQPAVETVIDAYADHGTACCERLLGDFAFAVWDRASNTLLCARDAFGVKPFYYSHRNGVFRFASEMGPLLAAPDADRSINEAMVAEFLACGISSATDTLFTTISRLPPAHALLVSATGVRVWRYWTPRVDTPHRESLADDVERLRGLLKTAVAARMRGVSRVGVTLSGGIDSSSIVVTAAAIARRQSAPVDVRAFSMSFDGRSCDERRFAETAATSAGVPLHLEPAGVPSSAQAHAYAATFADFPGYPNTMMFDRLRSAAARAGYRVLLTGEGGDDWFAGSYYHYADLIRQRRWRDVLAQYRADQMLAREDGIALPRFPLLRLGVWPLLSDGVRSALKPWFNRGAAPWISPVFARRVDLAARTAHAELAAGDSIAQARQVQATASGADAHYFEIAERSAAICGVEERHPFYDRRIVEFALSLPEERRWSGRENKRVLREAMRGQLPDLVRERTAKAHFSFVYAEMLETMEVAARADDPLSAWLKASAMARMRAQMRRYYRDGDERYTKCIWPLWMAAGIDLWLAVAQPGETR